jgi:four helix bundle protein
MKGGIENLEIYKLSVRLEVYVYKVTETFSRDEKFRSVNQLRRSSASSSDNISEAYHRFHFNDKINRLLIARGEAGETRDGIVRASMKGLVSQKISDFTYGKYTELIKGINGYIKYLRNKRDEHDS